MRRLLLKLSGLGLIGAGLAMFAHLLLVQINLEPYLWRGLVADLAMFFAVGGLIMLVAVPFAGLRQLGAAFLVLGIAISTVSRANVLTLPILWRIGLITVGIVSGYLLVLKGTLPKA